ncbi:MAG: chemotaxis protein CheW [Halobacteriota archaeon]|nr:chemotaxis protein CheW [Halobacteriota archaeon]
MAQTLQEPDILEGQFVVFELEDRSYGVDARQVREIVMIPELEQVFETPDFVEGVIYLHGHITAVVDLRRRYGIGNRASKEKETIIVIEQNEMQIGLVIDQVTDVVMVPLNSIDLSHDVYSDDPVECISGLCKLKDGSSLTIIDLEDVLSDTEIETIGNAIKNNAEPRRSGLFKRYI